MKGGLRKGAGRKRLPLGVKKESIAMRVNPQCKHWLKDKAMELDMSLGELVEQMMYLWQEQERRYYGIEESNEPYIKAFCTEFNKKMALATKEYANLPISEQLLVAEQLRKMAMEIRYGRKEEDGK